MHYFFSIFTLSSLVPCIHLSLPVSSLSFSLFLASCPAALLFILSHFAAYIQHIIPAHTSKPHTISVCLSVCGFNSPFYRASISVTIFMRTCAAHMCVYVHLQVSQLSGHCADDSSMLLPTMLCSCGFNLLHCSNWLHWLSGTQKAGGRTVVCWFIYVTDELNK